MGEWKKCKLKDICKTNASSYSSNDNYSFVNYLDTGNITQNVIDEVIDRFGNMPNELENLIEIARIKSLCKEKFVSKISSKKGFAVFTFEKESFDVDINELLKTYKNKIRFSPGLKPTVTLALVYNEDIKILKEIKEFLRNL